MPARTRTRRAVAIGVAAITGLLGTVAGMPGAGATPGCKDHGTVSDLGDDGGSRQLRAQLADACDGGTVQIVPGAIVLTQGPIVVDRDVTIRGLGPAANPTVIDGGGTSRVLEISSATVVVTDLRVTGGAADLGAGIRNVSGTLELVGVTVDHSVATNSGGGIETRGTVAGPARTTLRESTVTANRASFAGGGVANIGGGGDATLVLVDSVVSDNVASGPGTPFGGGIVSSKALVAPTGGAVSVVLDGASVVTGNRATFGGGIFSNGDGAAARVEVNGTSRIEGNQSVQQGGGLMHLGQRGGTSSVTLNDAAAVRDNHAGGRAGGVFNEGAFEMTGTSVVEGNSSVGDGGGVLNFSVTGPATVVLRDASAIRDNTAGTTGGGIANFPAGFPATVTLLDQAAVIGNLPNNCTNTPAC